MGFENLDFKVGFDCLDFHIAIYGWGYQCSFAIHGFVMVLNYKSN